MKFIKQQKGISTILSILLVVLLVTLVGGGVIYKYYVASPEVFFSLGPEAFQSKIASWGTYENQEYGIQIRYPEDWTAIESISPGYPYLVFVTFGPKEIIQQGGFFAVAVRAQTEEEYLSSLQKEFIIASSTKSTLGNRSATTYNFYRSGDQESIWKTVISPLDNLLFDFSKGATPNYNEIFDQMLSTFKIVQHE